MTRRVQRGAATVPHALRLRCSGPNPVRILPGVLFSQYPLEALAHPSALSTRRARSAQRDLQRAGEEAKLCHEGLR